MYLGFQKSAGNWKYTMAIWDTSKRKTANLSNLEEFFGLPTSKSHLGILISFTSFFEIFQNNVSDHISEMMTTEQVFLLIRMKKIHALGHMLPKIMVVYELKNLLKRCTNHTMVLQYVSFSISIWMIFISNLCYDFWKSR